MTQNSEIRRQLAELEGMAANARRADRNLTAAAAGRLNWVQARIVEIQQSVLTDPDANAEYLDLIEERGRLDNLLPGSRAD
jgi:hypothetical protein